MFIHLKILSTEMSHTGQKYVREHS